MVSIMVTTSNGRTEEATTIRLVVTSSSQDTSSNTMANIDLMTLVLAVVVRITTINIDLILQEETTTKAKDSSSNSLGRRAPL